LSKPLYLFKSYPAFNSFLYQRYTWYVHIGRKLTSLFFTVQYIGRYTKRPVIAETRISNYDGNNVSFWFDDRNIHDKVFISLAVNDFIARIIRHIPDKHFRQVRYFGVFANRVRNNLCKIIFCLLNKENSSPCIIASWRNRLFMHNGVDPLVCIQCNSMMLLDFVVFPLTRGAPV
jgi:hypothetical protein